MKYIVAILVCLISENIYSQDLISVASTFLNDQDYIEAKKAIDEAFEGQNVNDNYRAWFTKARIYHEIYNSKDANLRQFKRDKTAFVTTIVEAYNKTQSLTTRTSNLWVASKNQIEILWAAGINEGDKLFKEQRFEEAIKAFEVSKISKPEDAKAYIYSAICALYAGEYELAVENYLASKDLEGLSREAYDGLIIAKRKLQVPTEELLDVIEDARFNYPNHIPYIIEQLRTLIRLNKLEEAESTLNTAIQRNPNNAQLILRQADLFDIIFKSSYINGQPERSERYFEKASTNYERYLASFPDDFAANYNYAVMINEQANRNYVRINLMSNEEYELKGADTEEIGHDWTRKALPYMEKAWNVRPGDKKVKEALTVFYGRLKMDEKLAALNSNGN